MHSGPEWIKSGGGPLICVEKALAQYWMGGDANSCTRGADRDYVNDYSRACRVAGYIGKIALQDHHALILGDMPLQTAIWRPPVQNPGIIQVYYADPGNEVPRHLAELENIDFSSPIETTIFAVNSAPMMLFDSAYPGKEIGSAHLSFELAPGIYSVLTKPFSPDPRTSVLVHKFVPGGPLRI